MTEQEKIERAIERMKASVKNNVENTFAGYGWQWRGSSFFATGRYGIRGENIQADVRVEFNCKLMTVMVKVLSQDKYGVPDSIGTFGGDNAIQDCIDWTAQQVIDLYFTVKNRTAPYINGYEQYQRALRGE